MRLSVSWIAWHSAAARFGKARTRLRIGDGAPRVAQGVGASGLAIDGGLPLASCVECSGFRVFRWSVAHP
jgi:hypothetical protein